MSASAPLRDREVPYGCANSGSQSLRVRPRGHEDHVRPRCLRRRVAAELQRTPWVGTRSRATRSRAVESARGLKVSVTLDRVSHLRTITLTVFVPDLELSKENASRASTPSGSRNTPPQHERRVRHGDDVRADGVRRLGAAHRVPHHRSAAAPVEPGAGGPETWSPKRRPATPEALPGLDGRCSAGTAPTSRRRPRRESRIRSCRSRGQTARRHRACDARRDAWARVAGRAAARRAAGVPSGSCVA